MGRRRFAQRSTDLYLGGPARARGSAQGRPARHGRAGAAKDACRRASDTIAGAVHPGAVDRSLTLDLVDLAAPVVNEIVVTLHQLLVLLVDLRTQPLAPHHLLEGLHAGYLEFGNDRPVTLAAEVR